MLFRSMVLCSMAVDLLVFPLRQVQGSLMLIAFGVKTFNELSSTVQTAYDAIKLMGWKTLGSQVVEGFIAGIKGGLDSVRSALGNLGDTAKQALKKSLGIASPSKVMRELGGFTGDGYVEGVVDTHADAHAAIRGLGNASPDGARAGAAGAVASQSARSGITIQSVVVQVNAADKLDKSAAMSSDWVADMLARALEKSLIGAAA